VGLQNEIGSTPAAKSGRIVLFPWDFPQKRVRSWPPPAGAGNYASEGDNVGAWPANFGVIRGYKDGYPRTSPVGSFSVNEFGLYDIGGNVWQSRIMGPVAA
jgi:eukaryotic-like serine/threonine-protein kinase